MVPSSMLSRVLLVPAKSSVINLRCSRMLQSSAAIRNCVIIFNPGARDNGQGQGTLALALQQSSKCISDMAVHIRRNSTWWHEVACLHASARSSLA